MNDFCMALKKNSIIIDRPDIGVQETGLLIVMEESKKYRNDPNFMYLGEKITRNDKIKFSLDCFVQSDIENAVERGNSIFFE